ncbi:NADH-quinone oxidoreductase subunit J [Gleimia sp. 6138-11-ORH1]|uniref:NADH-quinone oxidoreductase subunit J n=1 Tax=Gleimia sp. 6138-11-ORH1 TaxID=2973937 RepID=UPI00216928C3|nr:NADH-quinone oxidoreductase subunit J [Gleimia sp. 6138-11-ORH1]MCS4484654.1 NADH-quinone oxidoreductase subunit J [Gleimia sp. 6138-11-ORH1]
MMPALLENTPQMSGWPEAILFIAVATMMIAGALGVLFFKKAAYAAISMVVVMLGLAIVYLMHSAPFLGTVQIVVYTGAIMMLFLFVLMMIGLHASDEYQTQKRSHIYLAVAFASAFFLALVAPVAMSQLDLAGEFKENPFSDAPIEELAGTIFANYWFSMELSGMLLIVAVIGAVLLTNADRLTKRHTQRSVVDAKMAAYAARGRHVGQMTAPGVYAQSTSVDVGALSGETLEVVNESIPRVLRVRGLDRSIGNLDPKLATNLRRSKEGDTTQAIHGQASVARVEQSQAWGMGGKPAETGLFQHEEPSPSVNDNVEGEEQK